MEKSSRIIQELNYKKKLILINITIIIFFQLV